MRRIVISFAVDRIVKILPKPQFDKIEFLEVLNFLKSTPGDVALVCGLKFKESSSRLEDVFDAKPEEVQILDRKNLRWAPAK